MNEHVVKCPGMTRILAISSLLLSLSGHADPSPALHIDADRITVSGISAGGAMAHQLHIAYSEVFSGAGIIAGVPYGCANGSLTTAMARCMGKTDEALPVAQFAEAMRGDAVAGRISEPAQLINDRVWLFHGRQDKVVAAPVSNALHALYIDFIPPEQVLYVNDIDAAHNFPARGHGSDCSVSLPPFVGNCDYDAAGEMLSHLYPGLHLLTSTINTELVSVSLTDAAEAGLSEMAYLFVPPACTDGKQNCALHVVLHGCAQSAVQIGTQFIEQSGYLPWAAANNIVMAFPQVAASAVNPYACWDWWGYTGENYRWRNGAQMTLLAHWVGALRGNS